MPLPIFMTIWGGKIIIRQCLVTSLKLGVELWRQKLQNKNVNISGAKCPIELKLCWPIYGGKFYQQTRVLWRHQKWAWPEDVINFKMWMSMSQEPNVRLSWNFAGWYRVARPTIEQSFMTSSKGGVAWWRHQLQNMNVNIPGTERPNDLKLCTPIWFVKLYHQTKSWDVI